MRSFSIRLAVLVAIGGLLAPSLCRAAEYYADKRATVPDVKQPAGEGSCWLVGASNMLAGAGWGTGADAQARGESIFKQLQDYYPNKGRDGGRTENALNWWLQTYGCTGQSPYYKVTRKDYRSTNGARKSDYDAFVLEELKRCQQVAVDWYWNEGTKLVGHTMTLVAGNKCDASQSVWRDGNTAAKDDVVSNSWQGTATDKTWSLGEGTTVPKDVSRAWFVELLCPGKPTWATSEYDVTWTAGGSLAESGRLKDVYDDPSWDGNKLNLDNVRIEDYTKQLFIELTFKDAQTTHPDLAGLISVGTTEASSVALRGGWHWYDDNKKALAKFVLKPQPGSEYITFGGDLLSSIQAFDVATCCIPLPPCAEMGLVLLVLVIFGTAFRRIPRR